MVAWWEQKREAKATMTKSPIPCGCNMEVRINCALCVRWRSIDKRNTGVEMLSWPVVPGDLEFQLRERLRRFR